MIRYHTKLFPIIPRTSGVLFRSLNANGLNTGTKTLTQKHTHIHTNTYKNKHTQKQKGKPTMKKNTKFQLFSQKNSLSNNLMLLAQI